MALAALRFEGLSNGVARLRVDIGKNRYYAYAIGEGRSTRRSGIKVLAEPHSTSPLLGPLPPSAMGRAWLEVPLSLFERERRHIQLASFRDEKRVGPAVSDIVEIPLTNRGEFGDLPEPSFSRTALHSTTMQLTDSSETEVRELETVPFLYREVAVSQAMFLDTLGKLLTQVVPVAVPVLEKLLAGGGKGAAAGGGAAASPGAGTLLAAIAKPEILQEILKLIEKLTAAKPQSQSLVLAAALRRSGRLRFGRGAYYSEAQIAPALLAALPALAGIVKDLAELGLKAQQQEMEHLERLNPGVHTPDIERLLAGMSLASGGRTRGQRHALRAGYSEAQIAPALLAALPAIAGIVKDLAELGLKAQQQEMQHLERLNPGVETPDIERLLAGMSLGTSRPARRGPTRPGAARALARAGRLRPDVAALATRKLLASLRSAVVKPSPELRYRQSDQVHLSLEDQVPLVLYGRERVVYRHGRDIELSLSLQAPRPIRQAHLQILVKDPLSQRVLVRRTHRLEQVEAGRLSAPPRLSRGELAGLEAGRDYLLSAVLVWKSKRGEQRGTSLTRLITLAGEYCFDRVENSAEPIPLGDVTQHRDYWHKVWQASFTSEFKTAILDASYYYSLDPARDRSARMETVTALAAEGLHKQVGRLKSGLVLSPYALNRLLPLVSAHAPLGEPELAALRCADFADRLSTAGRAKLTLKGRRGEHAALWVYPEIKLQRVVLQRAAQVEPSGQVTRLEEHVVSFPMPAAVHFIGASTQ